MGRGRGHSGAADGFAGAALCMYDRDKLTDCDECECWSAASLVVVVVVLLLCVFLSVSTCECVSGRL